MSDFVFQVLTYLAALITTPIGLTSNQDWQTDGTWTSKNQALVHAATSTTLSGQCREQIDATLVTPTILQGFHEFFVDTKLVFSSGDPTFAKGSQLYNVAEVPCRLLADGGVILWRVTNLTHSQAKLTKYPKLVNTSMPIERFFNSSLPLLAGGGLIFIGFMCFSMFYGRLPTSVPISLLGASCFMGLFFILSVPEAFGIRIPTSHLHRLHDTSLWIATVFIWRLLFVLCDVPKMLFITHFIAVVISVSIIAISQNLDQSQVGSTIAFLSNLLCLFACTGIQVIKMLRSKLSHLQILQLLSVISFCLAGINDILVNVGALDTLPMFSIGGSLSFILVALTANEKLAEIHRERDHLKENLEIEVEEKTRSLTEKSVSLEKALEDLKQAQAEVIQSSKLASLGTLSAGLAHEINNSLNYPTGALPALRRIMAKDTITPEEKSRVNEMLKLIGEGLDLTSNIIKNLKRYTGSAQAARETIDLKQLIEGVLLLLRSQIKETASVHVNIPEAVVIEGSRVGLSQIVMNIITNAIDALKDKKQGLKEIRVDVSQDHTETILNIRDTGAGIPGEILDKVLDPFFTTKEPGKGTGLGLFIVNKEITAMGGKLQIDSKVGEGTAIKLIFPRNKQRVAA